MSPNPPVARVGGHVREHHGDRVIDPYEWLREADDPEVVAYLTAENAYAQALTEPLEPLRSRLYDEIKSRVKETDLSVPVASGPWWYYSRTDQGQQYPIHARCPRAHSGTRPELEAGDIAGEQILVDGNVEAGVSDFFAIGALTVSHDHRRLALATDHVGDERFSLVIRDLDTGEVLDEALTGIGYGVEFDLSGEYVFYTRLDDAWRPYQLWRHAVGRSVDADVLLHEEPDERFWMGIGSSRDERWLVHALGSQTSSEVRLLDSANPLGEWHVVAARTPGVEYDVEPAGDRLYIVHNRDNPESDLAWAPARASSMDQWHPIVRPAPGERFLGVDAFDEYLVLSLRAAGLPTVRIIPVIEGTTGVPQNLALAQGLCSITLGDNLEPDQRSILLTVESYVTPRTVVELDVASGSHITIRKQPVLGDFHEDDYEQHRAWAVATDGVSVPISIVRRVGVASDGRSPGFLTAYGAYEISSDPYFSVARLSLLDRGVVFAVAHARGGGELGRNWYDGGKLLDKPNTFSDTVAVARALGEQGWIDPNRLALEGGSAGGLLVGAVLNQAPGLFRVAHAAVPFVDALTTILRPELPLTVGEWEEWGNPLADPQVYACMKGYSPYENIAAAPYPAILATTSLQDTRVSFTEPAKWIARLRATVTNDPTSRPIILKTELAAGHGGRSGRYAAWEQTAWEWAFVLDQLGAPDVLPGRPA